MEGEFQLGGGEKFPFPRVLYEMCVLWQNVISMTMFIYAFYTVIHFMTLYTHT